MASLVRNRHSTPVTLPYPYSGVLMGGEAVVLSGEPATVIPRLGLGAEHAFEVTPVPDSQLLNSPTNGTYLPPAGAKLLSYPGIAAKGATDIAPAIAGSAVSNAFTVASPAHARNLRVTMDALWDGGDVTVHGTDQLDAAQSEVFLAGTNVVRVGTKVFKTVTSASKGAVGLDAATASIGTGDKLGAGLDPTGALLFASGVAEAGTFDAANLAFTPTTIPTGSVDYTLLMNVTQPA